MFAIGDNTRGGVNPALNAEQTGLNRENQSQKASVGGTRGKSRINKIIVKIGIGMMEL